MSTMLFVPKTWRYKQHGFHFHIFGDFFSIRGSNLLEYLSYSNRSLPLIEKKKSPKMWNLSDFNKISYICLLMNEFVNTSVILLKTSRFFSGHLTSPTLCVALFNWFWYNLIGYILSVYNKKTKVRWLAWQ